MEREAAKPPPPVKGIPTIANFHVERLNDGRADVLIIEFNAPKLRDDRISVGRKLYCDIRDEGLNVACVRGQSREGLRKGLLRFADLKFAAIVCIGHANEGGMHLSSDDETVADGDVLAEWLAPFDPEQLILLGCHVLNLDFAVSLFNGLENLTDIYGTPTKTHPPSAIDLTVTIVCNLFDDDYAWGRRDTREAFDFFNEIIVRIPIEVVADEDRSLSLEERLERSIPAWDRIRESRKKKFQGRRRRVQRRR